MRRRSQRLQSLTEHAIDLRIDVLEDLAVATLRPRRVSGVKVSRRIPLRHGDVRQAHRVEPLKEHRLIVLRHRSRRADHVQPALKVRVTLARRHQASPSLEEEHERTHDGDALELSDRPTVLQVDQPVARYLDLPLVRGLLPHSDQSRAVPEVGDPVLHR